MERIHCAEKKHTGCAERKRTLTRRLPNWRALKYITAKLLFLSKNRQNNGSPLRLQGIKITRRRFWKLGLRLAHLAACSDRFWFPAENMRSCTCFAGCSFQWNKDFVMIYTPKPSGELQRSHLRCGIINAKSCCSASLQWSVYWITLPYLRCGIMPAEDYNGFAERTRTLKRRLPDWRALEWT